MYVGDEHTPPFEVLPLAAWVLTDRNATVAAVTMGDLSFTGSAKREPGDANDQETAKLLAVGRALHLLAESMIETGLERVAKAEAVSQEKLARRILRRIKSAEQEQIVARKAAAGDEVARDVILEEAARDAGVKRTRRHFRRHQEPTEAAAPTIDAAEVACWLHGTPGLPEEAE